jgi:hypothetical protein
MQGKITVWKDGSYVYEKPGVHSYYENDEDWLTTIYLAALED